MNTIKEKIERYGVLPVINVTEEEKAIPLANALKNGGLPLVEITLRSKCSLKAISLIKDTYPEMLVGAGTVLSVASVDEAIAAGADYVVSPGYDREVVDYCCEKGILIVPGCSTASEIQDAVKKGLRVIKFFPAELGGGVEAIKLLSGPFPEVRFLPTGGITFANLEQYLSCDKIIACGGSFMATAQQLKNNDFEGIEISCKKAVSLSLGFKLAHVGINHNNRDEALKTARTVSALFGFSVRECSTSSFAGNVAECMDHSTYGKHGHIGLSTNSITRAMAFLEEKGVEFDINSIKRNDKGDITCIYLKDDIGGFAWHIVKN